MFLSEAVSLFEYVCLCLRCLSLSEPVSMSEAVFLSEDVCLCLSMFVSV